MLKIFKKFTFLLILTSLLLPFNQAIADSLASRLKGWIVLQVEENGEAWYIYPKDEQRYYLGRPDDAFQIMRELGLGITNENLAKIPEAGQAQTGDPSLISRLKGQILLQVEENGEAWYVYPDNGKRYYLGRPDDAFQIMRELGLGISNQNLSQITISATSPQVPVTQNNFADFQIEIINLINEKRQLNGLKKISLNNQLNTAAQNHAEDMITNNYFNSVSPNGFNVVDRVIAAGYSPRNVQETSIQGVGQASNDVQQVFDFLYNDPESQQLVLDTDFQELGVGKAHEELNGDIKYYWVFDFAYSNQSVINALSDLEKVRQEVLAEVNLERVKLGLNVLSASDNLNVVSQNYAEYMLAENFFDHQAPDGTTPIDRVNKLFPNTYRYIGENLAYGPESPLEVMQEWINSPEHYENIIDPNFKKLGIGVAYEINQNNMLEIYWVQNFGTRFE